MSAVTRMTKDNDDPSVLMKDWTENYRVLQEQNGRLERANAELMQMNERLIQENCMLRENLEREIRKKDSLQAYSVTLTTRLETIEDIVAAARRDATSQANFVIRRAGEPQARPAAPSRVEVVPGIYEQQDVREEGGPDAIRKYYIGTDGIYVGEGGSGGGGGTPAHEAFGTEPAPATGAVEVEGVLRRLATTADALPAPKI
jgi:hypothetical protein